MSKPHRNTQERKDMLRLRAHAQRTRTPGFTPMHKKPPGYVSGKWEPAGEKIDAAT